jgi:hypothetical protein
MAPVPRIDITVLAAPGPLLGYRVFTGGDRTPAGAVDVARGRRETVAEVHGRALAIAYKAGKGILRIVMEIRGR